MNAFILKKPVITEKSLRLANEQNTYTFEVPRTATKNQIKVAAAQVFDVTVLSVRTIMSARKAKRTGRKRVPNILPKTKKALVTLEKGQVLDIFEVEHA